ncbi:acylphosphatase [Mesorhizobium sp. BR1-1-2]|uniref:acylphosphatase n=1 Tax=Mesorhizobium sp. BR1-1-2 TaxID=2876652 RepID=UPI001CC98C26|nr:acylphosphatase [Mesorhizobium sp. BR1-1-2]MBZ9965143.1 acylphosphatase [Mesorhizobium sp. BR1-1-2]
MADDRKAVRVQARGKVQGVGYRIWVRSQAASLGLAGWVRNEADGSVTAEIVGTGAAVSTMIERFWKGPPGASVSRVDVEDAASGNLPTGFRIDA